MEYYSFSRDGVLFLLAKTKRAALSCEVVALPAGHSPWQSVSQDNLAWIRGIDGRVLVVSM